MSMLWQNTKNEYFKLAHRKKYLVFIIIEIVICICVLLVQSAANRVIDGPIVLQINNMAMAMLTFFIIIYIPLVVFMACSDLFSAEMGDSSIKAVLLRPISRAKIFFSKTLAVILFAAQYLIVLLLITTILELISGGSASRFWSSLGSYLFDIIPLIIAVFMAVLINQFTKSSSLAMFMCILIYAVFYIVGIFVPSTSGMFFTGYMQWHKLWLGAAIPVTAMLSKIGILCGYGLVFGGAGFYIFDKRDF